jgi:hypothetical protein
VNVKMYWPLFVPLSMATCCLVKGAICVFTAQVGDVLIWWGLCLGTFMVAAVFADTINESIKREQRGGGQ